MEFFTSLILPRVIVNDVASMEQPLKALGQLSISFSAVVCDSDVNSNSDLGAEIKLWRGYDML
jgi:hypothetical protein